MNLFEELKNVLSKLDSEKVDYALCGGLAMAVYAFPRSTLDIDIMIDRGDLEKTKTIAQDLGFTIDAGLTSFSGGNVQIYRVTKIEADTGETLPLDLILVSEATKDAWDSRAKMEWDHGVLSVVSLEGLIHLKSLRGSGQDEDDIARLRSILDEDRSLSPKAIATRLKQTSELRDLCIALGGKRLKKRLQEKIPNGRDSRTKVAGQAFLASASTREASRAPQSWTPTDQQGA